MKWSQIPQCFRRYHEQMYDKYCEVTTQVNLMAKLWSVRSGHTITSEDILRAHPEYKPYCLEKEDTTT